MISAIRELHGADYVLEANAPLHLLRQMLNGSRQPLARLARSVRSLAKDVTDVPGSLTNRTITLTLPCWSSRLFRLAWLDKSRYYRRQFHGLAGDSFELRGPHGIARPELE